MESAYYDAKLEGASRTEEVFMAFRQLFCASLLAVLLAVTASAEKGKDQGPTQNKDVIIRTPIGSLEVHSDQVDPKLTGLPLCPGARRIVKKDDETSSASIRLDTFSFGLKVVAVSFETDDPPEKVLNYYRKELKKEGKIIECLGEIDFEPEGDREAQCEDAKKKASSDVTELGVGTREHHRIVKVERQGKGTKLGLVRIDQRYSSQEPL